MVNEICLSRARLSAPGKVLAKEAYYLFAHRQIGIPRHVETPLPLKNGNDEFLGAGIVLKNVAGIRIWSYRIPGMVNEKCRHNRI